MFSVFSGNPFDALVDEATSELLPGAQEDLNKNMEICDTIKGRAVPCPVAARALRRRLAHYNPNVQLLALRLTDCCVKNCGRSMLREIASRDFVDCLLGLVLNANTHDRVREDCLQLFQQWAIVFQQYPDLQYMADAFETMRREHPDIQIPAPPLDLAIHLVTECREPPEWTDSAACERCRAVFTVVTNRKHHCRACGRTFCGSCSAKSKPLPDFGYNQAVRVCDPCFYAAAALPCESKQPVDNLDDFDRAVQLSLQEKEQEDRRRQQQAAHSSPNEEAQLQAAITASRQGKPAVLTAVERENVHLFARLVEAGASKARSDREMVRMAGEMRTLRRRIEEAMLGGPSLGRTEKADLTRLGRLLDDALVAFDEADGLARAEPKRDDDVDKIKDLIGL